MRLLKDELTFGSNRSFLGYEDWGFPFRYWGISDRLQIEMYREEYEAGMDADSIKFIPFEYLGFLRMPNQVPVPMPGEQSTVAGIAVPTPRELQVAFYHALGLTVPTTDPDQTREHPHPQNTRQHDHTRRLR